MDPIRRWSPGLRLIAVLTILSQWLLPVSGLYFYLSDTNPKCFFEELPRDTLVVGA